MLWSKRLRVIERQYCRYSDWYVEVAGRKLARLVDALHEDMFWVSFRIEPLTNEEEGKELLTSGDFWHSPMPVFRSCEFDDVAPFAYAGGGLPDQLSKHIQATGRISMRGLYLEVRGYPWDWLVLCLKRWLTPDPNPHRQ